MAPTLVAVGLLGNGGVGLKPETAVDYGIVKASKRDGLRLDLDMELYAGFGMAQDGLRVLGDPGSVLVVDGVQLERVELVRADDVGGGGCVHWLAMHGMWCVEWFLDGCGKWNSY